MSNLTVNEENFRFWLLTQAGKEDTVWFRRDDVHQCPIAMYLVNQGHNIVEVMPDTIAVSTEDETGELVGMGIQTPDWAHDFIAKFDEVSGHAQYGSVEECLEILDEIDGREVN